MLGLILIYFIGKKFYELAEEYEKHKWGLGILGVVIYYAGSIISVLLIGVILALSGSSFFENSNSSNDLVAGLIGLPFGLLSCYILYMYLEKKWKKEIVPTESLIDQIGNDKSL